MTVISNSYASAIFELGLENNSLDSYLESFKKVSNILSSNSDLMEVFNHPQITLNEKLLVAKDIFNDIEKDILNFILVMVEKQRISEVFNAYDDFEMLYNHHNNIYTAEVYTVILLDNMQISKLENNLSLKLGKKIKVKNIVDESIVGGMKIKIENQILDATIQTKIDSLKSDLHSIQIK